MSKAFKGSINVDIRDSVPDWAPFEPPKAPDGAPNVVYIVLDDVGFSAMNCYGGPVETPNIDRIAADGWRRCTPGSLYHGDRKVGEARIKNQPGYYELAGEARASAATAPTPSPTTTRGSARTGSPAAPSSGS